MATVAEVVSGPRSVFFRPSSVERTLALLSGVMAAVVLTALLRGSSEWHRIPGLIWFHIATIGIALLLSPVILLRRRGDRLHRWLGYTWGGAIVATAVATFWIRESSSGQLSYIHILSAFTLVQVPRLIMAARRQDLSTHRSGMLWMIAGALLIAGFFTFLPQRILGSWLLG